MNRRQLAATEAGSAVTRRLSKEFWADTSYILYKIFVFIYSL